ncbi:zinc metalloproteinase nas-13 [Danaus plexippus plexippus]|uniref:Metalloendopeptidase n=1 Tax=Danaus plexippus plexippus TaxID=278856 RepID=A0A212FMB2_DANPL|nr:zinc metalloproteinase nas-13 [Danaus plexippus plexippus]
MMAVLQLMLYMCVAGSITALPVDDDVVMVGDDSNAIEDSDVIDLSGLGPEAFTFPKNESGDALATWTESSLMNPEEMSFYGEGDILIPTYGRNAVRDQTSRWPNGHIPYLIDGSFNQNQRDNIMKAIADYHRLTCLRFIPYNGQRDYIVFKSANTGCWSSVGRLGGRQEVNLQTPGCVSKKGTVLHEILHAVGFIHEQSRPERDDFVKINYNNIRSGSEGNFKKSDSKRVADLGIPYDYNSVMHYSEYAFSKNSKKTIEPKTGGMKVGQREGLSRGDVKKVNAMYNCKKEEPQTGWVGSVWQSIFG